MSGGRGFSVESTVGSPFLFPLPPGEKVGSGKDPKVYGTRRERGFIEGPSVHTKTGSVVLTCSFWEPSWLRTVSELSRVTVSCHELGLPCRRGGVGVERSSPLGSFFHQDRGWSVVKNRTGRPDRLCSDVVCLDRGGSDFLLFPVC